MDLILWGAVCVLLCVAECVTMQLVSIWFAAGALVSFFAALFGMDMTGQLALFVAISAILLAATRPMLQRMRVTKIAKTNADREIGETACVIEAIDNAHGTGRATRNGIDWCAISVNDDIIPVGTIVTIQEIRGAKLLVYPAQTPAKLVK